MLGIEQESKRIFPPKELLEIQGEDSLKSVLEHGLTTLYQSVFAGPPYFEKFSNQEVEETFKEILNGNGLILVLKEEDQVISFATGASLSNFGPEALKERYSPEETFYFAELGVKEDRRREGIGTLITKSVINNVKQRFPQLKTFCMRTSVDNLPSIGLATKVGLAVIPDLREFVLQERQDGFIKADERLFMAMML